MTAVDRRLGVYGGAAIKLPCRVATTANITLDGLQTIDGVALAANDRVLVRSQTDATENGVYVADTGEWQRALDFNGPRDIVQGTLVVVLSGDSNPLGWTIYELATANPEIGVSVITFSATSVVGEDNALMSVEDLAELKGLRSRPATVIVKSGQAAGTWQWEAGDTATPNDGLVVQCAFGPAGRYKRIYDGPLYSEWFGAALDGVTDDRAAIQATLDAAGQIAAHTRSGSSEVRLSAGVIKIGSSLALPNGVKLIGDGCGDPELNTVPATKFIWAGGATHMLAVGAHAVGNPHNASDVVGIAFDGGDVATEAILIKDLEHSRFEDMSLRGCTYAHMRATNSTNGGNQRPTGHLHLENIFIQAWSDTIANAHGIFLDGVGIGVEGVTLSSAKGIRINHKNGDGVRLGDHADAWTWDLLQTWAAPGSTGRGFNSASTSDDQITSGHVWGLATCTHGIHAAHPKGLASSTILNLCDTDANATDPHHMLSGYAVFNVSMLTSYSTKVAGPQRVFGFLDTPRHDTMTVIRWDSTNEVLHTAQGAWLTGTDNNGAIDDGGQPGGSTVVKSGDQIGNVSYILDAPLGSGPTLDKMPQVAFIGTPISNVNNAVTRVGLFGDLTDPPNSCVIIEGDTSGGRLFFDVVVRSGGGATTRVATPVGVDQALVQWRIEMSDAGYVRVAYRTAGNYSWGYMAPITTNIPSSQALSFGAWVKTLEAGTHWYSLVDYRRAHNTEI